MKDLSEFWQYKLSVYLWKSFPPFFLVLGTLGNLLAILVLMQRKNRRSTQALYLTALAITDIMVLWVGLFRLWVKFTFGIDVRDLSIIGCKLHVFLTYTVINCSSWFLVAFTLERLFVVFCPHKVKHFSNCRNAVRVITLITLSFMFLNTHWLYGITLKAKFSNHSVQGFVCYLSDDVYEVFFNKWKWIDICIHSVIPSALLLMVNISIFSRLAWRRFKRRMRVAPITSNKEKLSQITVMLCMTSSVFILCTTPISVVLITCSHDSGDSGEPNVSTVAVYALRWALVNMFMYLNHVLNFVLYFLSGSKFRRQTKDFMCITFGNCKLKKDVKIHVHVIA